MVLIKLDESFVYAASNPALVRPVGSVQSFTNYEDHVG
jgi:hypothetical protein